MSDPNDRVALVTGGSRGIGKAIALALAAAGAAVAVNYRERSGEAEAVAESIRKNDGRAAAFGADVSDRSGVQRMVRDIRLHDRPDGRGQRRLAVLLRAATHI